MKYKMIFSIVLLFAILLPTSVFAISSSGGYQIEFYNIDMIVNENNTFDITETITANFTGIGQHGLFRKIPLRNTVERLDGTKSSNRAKISNISVSDKYKTYNENGYKVIKIGDSNKTVSGRKTYTIKYTYNIGKDPLKNADELYFNLIGNEWDVTINNVNFNITMPKSFDKSKLGFSTGYKYSTNNSNVRYTVSGNTIMGSLNEPLISGQALTIRLTLPEGYFVGASSNFDYFMIFKIIIPIVFVLIAYIMWKKYGKDEMVIDTVEFYPPDNLNSTDIGFIYKGYSEQNDVVSLLIYLANKGYLKIEELEEKNKSAFKSNDFKIIKIKEYDGNNEDERTFFNGLFKEKDEVTKDDLYDKFYITIDKIVKNKNAKENQEKIFEKTSLSKRKIILGMIAIIFLTMCGLTSINLERIFIIFFSLGALSIPISFAYKGNSTLAIILSSIIFVILSFFVAIDAEGMFSASFLIQFIVQIVCIITLIVFISIMKKRTKYGIEMLGKIQGFKNFLEMAEKPKLEELVTEDPKYFYNILPYTYVLGVSSKWISNFESIALEEPDWYYGYTSFDRDTFCRSINTTYFSIYRTMTSSPSSSSSGGSSGGGFSGGGSGGGGGGSW